MAFCTNCGAELNEGDVFCTHCGSKAAAPGAQPIQNDTVYGAAAQNEAVNESVQNEPIPDEAAQNEQSSVDPAQNEQAAGQSGQHTYTVPTEAQYQQNQQYQQSQQYQQNQQGFFAGGQSSFNGTDEQFSAEDIQSNKFMSVLAYISWLVIIPLLAAKNSPFARFHTNQGLVLTVSATVAVFVLKFLAKLPLIGILFGIARSAVFAFWFVLSIMGVINAAKGKAKELPLIGSFKILK